MANSYLFLSAGPVPASIGLVEECTPCDGRPSRMMCRVFRRMLQRLHPVPVGVDARFVVKKHRCGSICCRDVGVEYAGEGGLDFAMAVEDQSPYAWDGVAVYELAWFQRRRELRRAVGKGEVSQKAVPEQYVSTEPPILDAEAVNSLLAWVPPWCGGFVLQRLPNFL